MSAAVLNSSQLYGVGTIIVLILQMKKSRHREVKYFAQDYSTSKLQSQCTQAFWVPCLYTQTAHIFQTTSEGTRSNKCNVLGGNTGQNISNQDSMFTVLMTYRF